jgi:hypothetical protein
MRCQGYFLLNSFVDGDQDKAGRRDFFSEAPLVLTRKQPVESVKC